MSVGSLRSHEGELLLDHRDSPGIPDAIVVAHGLPAGAGRGVFETATYTCSHCTGVVVMHPNRSRPREYCRGCDHYICDGCGAIKAANGGKCVTFNQVVDEILNAAAR